MQPSLWIAGHTGLLGSALVRTARADGQTRLILRTRQELDLLDGGAVRSFLAAEKPDCIILCAAKVRRTSRTR